jgi:hypothetical protein
MATPKIQNRSEYENSEAVNIYMLEVDKRITEGIKWNSPSFYCNGWFATVNLHGKNGVQVVLHHGAKIRADSTLSFTIDDPSHLLTWPSKDRAIVTFDDAENFQKNRAAFKTIIKQWSTYQAELAPSK